MSDLLEGSGVHQVGPGMHVELGYAVFDADEEPVDSPPGHTTLVFGYGQLLPDLERAIDGLSPGQTRSVSLRPSAAFGRRRKEALLEVDRDDFPADVAPGDRFEAESAAGITVVLKVLEVLEDRVVIDTNHPLAGQKLRFELEIRSVRPATAAEIESALARLSAQNPPDAIQLISPGSLLGGGGRRYTSDPAADSSAAPAEASDGRSPARRNDP